MQEILVDLDGKQERVWVHREKGVFWIHLRGRTIALNEDESRGKRSRSGGASAHPGRIQAPMPGKVIKVLVVAGANVSVGQPLVILEAMKMEYTLAADIAGTIATVGAKVGEQVSLGQVLIQVQGE